MSTKTKTTEAEASTDAGQLMYLGPSMLTPVPLTHRTVYVGGIPEFAKRLTQNNPDLAACFIPLKDAGKALRELEGHPDTGPGEITRLYKSVSKTFVRSDQ